MVISARPTTPGPLSYARVAIARPLGQPYTYYIPEAMEVKVGSLVAVPLRSDTAEGVVVDLIDAPDTKARIKPIERHLSPDYAIEPPLIDLARWMADYYFCAWGEALATVSMIGLRDVAARTETHLVLADPEHWLTNAGREYGPDGGRATAGHRQAVAALLAAGNQPMTPEELRAEAGVGEGVLQTILKRGWLRRVQEPVWREDDYGAPAGAEDENEARPAAIILTPAQRDAYAELETALHSGAYAAFLLHGVTGSGKTELYLRLIEEGLRSGRTAIVLVPEIALTPQVVEAFRRRLGGLVGVYHSKQSVGQKYDLWRRIRAGEVRVVVGARSALFAPLPSLGIVVVDEEHETTYKQAETPRYHARDMAVLRAARQKA
ncbi:MAG: DEAD/DEAH box helicase family protein, partial [bacterium]|nr:DEAD/DEAH box helicase family protein [bacterium]